MKTYEKLYVALDLHLFDGDGGGAEGAAGAAPAPGADPAPGKKAKAGRNPLADVKYGKQAEAPKPEEAAPAQEIPEKAAPETLVTSDTEEARRAEFEKLIKGDYKDLYDARVQQTIDTRFKQVKALEAKAAQADALNPVLDLLASKYGVEGSNTDALVKAIQEDDSYYEREATEKGLSVDQLKQMKKLERENAEFRRMVQEQERAANADKVYQQWQQQSDALKQIYPGYDLKTECNHPETGKRFMGLLQSGVDVRTAYEVVHKDELIGGAMQFTAQTVQQKTLNDIKTRGMRPAENGASGTGAATIVKSDPSKFTKKDREEIARRVMRGERIEL